MRKFNLSEKNIVRECKRLFCQKWFLYTLIGCGVFFYIFDSIPVIVFLLLLDAIFLAIFVLYRNSRPAFFYSVLSAALSSGISYSVVRLLRGYELRPPTGWEGLLACLTVIFTGLFLQKIFNSKESEGVSAFDELFQTQKHDIDRLRRYIIRFPLLGINAKWGNGKSFVWTHLCGDPEIRKNFDIIQIDLLNVDLDSVEIVLINELERLLENYCIYPRSSRHLKALLGKNQWIYWFSSMAGDGNDGLAASFQLLQEDLGKIPKKVLIGFEDIDRISDSGQIKKIFAIAEKLSSDRIHIAFQYNIDLLRSVDNGILNRDYLEKYIPFTVSLTEMPFQELVRILWNRLDMDSLPVDPKKIYYIGTLYPNFWTVRHIWKFEGLESLETTRIPVDSLATIRKVRDYLLELKEMLPSNPLFCRGKNAETVCYILFIKHFFPTYFDLLTIGESPLETFYFIDQDGKEQYTLPEVLKSYQFVQGEKREAAEERAQKLDALFSVPENGRRLALLMLLGYSFSFSQARLSEPFSPGQVSEEKNQKIDHLVWNLIANGSSELTDAENDINQLEKIVLNQPEAEWKRNWERFLNDRYNGKFAKINNKTVARMGHGQFIDTFRAMQLTGSAGRVQSRFLPVFFFLYGENGKSKITIELLECLVCCDLTQKRDFFELLKFFNSLSVEGSPAAASVYRTFFARYMGNICILGYCERLESWMFELPLPQKSGAVKRKADDNLVDAAKKSLMELQQELEYRKKKNDIPYILPFVQEEYEILLDFVQKNQELLECSGLLPEPGVKVSVGGHRTIWPHQEEIDHLIDLKKKDKAAFDSALKESYSSGKLYLSELKLILSREQDSDEQN